MPEGTTSDEEVTQHEGFRALIGKPVDAVQAPYHRWQQRRGERRRLEAAADGIRRDAAGRMRGFHDELWRRWQTKTVEGIRGKETGNDEPA